MIKNILSVEVYHEGHLVGRLAGTTDQVGFYAEEAARILQSDFSGSLNEMVNKAGSSGGARPKVLITIDGADWIVKFRAADGL